MKMKVVWESETHKLVKRQDPFGVHGAGRVKFEIYQKTPDDFGNLFWDKTFTIESNGTDRQQSLYAYFRQAFPEPL